MEDVKWMTDSAILKRIGEQIKAWRLEMNMSQVHLAPAYDMVFSYNPRGQWANAHQLTINGKRDTITAGYAREEGVPSAEIDHITAVIKEKRALLFA